MGKRNAGPFIGPDTCAVWTAIADGVRHGAGAAFKLTAIACSRYVE